MRVGIIGTNWGLMHVGGFRGAGAEVVALCGKDPGKTRATAERERVALATTDLAELIEASDIVVVASPDAQHHEHARLALGAGRHVLVEKPLTLEAESARELVLSAQETPGLVCAVNFPYRALAPFSALRQWLSRRTDFERLELVLRSGFIERGNKEGPLVGASGDFGGTSHVIDAALWLAGEEPTWVQAALEGRPAHGVSLQLGLTSGAMLSLVHRPSAEPGIHGRWSIGGRGFEAQLDGGFLPELGGWRVGPARVFEAGAWTELSARVAPVPGRREPWAEAHVEVARAFLSAVKGTHLPQFAPVSDGARVQRVLDAAMRSESMGSRVPLR